MSAARSVAWAYGLACTSLFAVAVAAMVAGMYSGMTLGLGRAGRLGWLTDTALLGAFVALHSGLLTRRGRKLLARLAPRALGRDLSTTTYAIASSLALLALFALWTPSGVVWWRATGVARLALTLSYAAAWLVVVRALCDASLPLQTGQLGWRAVAAGRRPAYPAMPERGLFAVTRQPVYVGFVLTLWTTPTWTPDQLALAVTLTTYCVVAPRWKEARFASLYGETFERYRGRVPYWLPIPRRRA